jgi:O-antigen/teichoic acid export membrane protein
MESTVTAAAIVVGLSVWHLRNRRHPGWLASEVGRSSIFSGYLLVAIAAYWLEAAPTATAWEWALGNLWALAGMVAFVVGFAALNRATARHGELAQQFETVDPTVDAVRHSS